VVPTDHDIFAAICGHTMMDNNQDEAKTVNCELESEHPIVRKNEAQRALKIITQYYDAHGSALYLARLTKAIIKLHEANEDKRFF
jgi:hypothetical protein